MTKNDFNKYQRLCDIEGCEEIYTSEIHHNISLDTPIHFNLCAKHNMEFTKKREDNPFCVPKNLGRTKNNFHPIQNDVCATLYKKMNELT